MDWLFNIIYTATLKSSLQNYYITISLPVGLGTDGNSYFSLLDDTCKYKLICTQSLFTYISQLFWKIEVF